MKEEETGKYEKYIQQTFQREFTPHYTLLCSYSLLITLPIIFLHYLFRIPPPPPRCALRLFEVKMYKHAPCNCEQKKIKIKTLKIELTIREARSALIFYETGGGGKTNFFCTDRCTLNGKKHLCFAARNFQSNIRVRLTCF